MAYVLNQNLNGTVEQAASLISELVAREEQKSGGKDAAAKTLSNRYRLPYGIIRALLQPSRRPKTIDACFWFRLHDGYLSYCRNQIYELQCEIERVERLGASDEPAKALVDKAQALIDRLKKLS